MSSVPSCSSEGGNTKTPSLSPCVRWCFTLNNYTDDEVKAIMMLVPKYCKKALIGKEVGEEGTPHLQGYINLKTEKKTRTPSTLLKIPRAHFERCKGSEASNLNYCGKDDDVILSLGIYKPISIDKNLLTKDWQLKALKILEVEPDYRSIHWFWEYDGNKGKTLLQKYIFSAYPNTIVLSGKAADMKNAIVEYVKVNNMTPRNVLINLPRSVEHVSWGGLEEIKDMFFYSGKYEGGMISGKNPHMLVFANVPATDLMGNDAKFSLDRVVDHHVK